MKISVSPDDFADFCILFFLDCMANKKMLVRKTNTRFNAVLDKLTSMGFKSIFLMMFFTISPMLRQRYSQIKEIFEKKSSNQHYIYISQDAEYAKIMKKSSGQQDVKQIKKAINNTMKLLNAGKDINPQGLQRLQEAVINKMIKEGDL